MAYLFVVKEVNKRFIIKTDNIKFVFKVIVIVEYLYFY